MVDLNSFIEDIDLDVADDTLVEGIVVIAKVIDKHGRVNVAYGTTLGMYDTFSIINIAYIGVNEDTRKAITDEG